MSVEGRTNKAPALFFYHADVKIAVFLSIFAMTIIFDLLNLSWIWSLY